MLGEKPGLVVKADGSRSRGRGFEPRRRILGHTKKILKKETLMFKTEIKSNVVLKQFHITTHKNFNKL
jgi:hypothetical protein